VGSAAKTKFNGNLGGEEGGTFWECARPAGGRIGFERAVDAIEELDARLVSRLVALPVPVGVMTAADDVGELKVREWGRKDEEEDVASSNVTRNRELFDDEENVDDKLAFVVRLVRLSGRVSSVVFVLGAGGRATEGQRRALGAVEERLGSISSREENMLMVTLESVKLLGVDGYVTSSGVLRFSSAIEEADE
jgi:hypothetical protein